MARRPKTWTSWHPEWLKMGPYERAAVMSLMEANQGKSYRQDAQNVLQAMVNRARYDKRDKYTPDFLGQQVSQRIYQPTIERDQMVRLQRLRNLPWFKEHVQYAKDYDAGNIPDNIKGADKFLAPASTMVSLYRKNPDKYHNWGPFKNSRGRRGINWTNYDPSTGKYGGQVFADRSHSFIGNPDRTYDWRLKPGQVRDKLMADIVKTIETPGASPVRTVPPVQVAKNEIKPPPPGRMGAGLKDVIPPPPAKGPGNLRPILSPEEQKTYVAGPTTPVSNPVQTVVKEPTVAKEDEEEIVAAVPNKVGDVNRDIDNTFVRDADGRITGVRVTSPEEQVAEIEARYGGVGDRRRALAQELFQSKPMNWGQRIGGGLELAGAAIAMANGSPGAQRWGANVLGGNSIYGRHQGQMSELEKQLRQHQFDVADQSLVSGANESAALYKKMREQKAAARQKANNILQIYAGPDGAPTQEGVRAAAAHLVAAGLESEAKRLMEGFKAETGATPEQEAAIEGKYTTGPNGELVPAGEGVYGVEGGHDITVDPAEADLAKIQQENAAARSGVVTPTGETIMPTQDLYLAESRIKQLRREADRAEGVGELDLAKSKREQAKQLAEESGTKSYATTRAKKMAEALIKAEEKMTPKEAFEFRKGIIDHSTKVESRLGAMDAARRQFDTLFTKDKKGNLALTPAAASLFGGWANYFEVPPQPGTEEYNALAAFNGLKEMFASEGLQTLREAGVAPGSVTENEWKLFISRIAKMDRGMSPESAIKELSGARDLFDKTEDTIVKQFNKTYQGYIDGDFYDYAGRARPERLSKAPKGQAASPAPIPQRTSEPPPAAPQEAPKPAAQQIAPQFEGTTASGRRKSVGNGYVPDADAVIEEDGHPAVGSMITLANGRRAKVVLKNGEKGFDDSVAQPSEEDVHEDEKYMGGP